MAAEIRVPSVGESITEVTISQWLKPEGSWVEKDEPVVSLETDKVNVDVPAPNAGVLAKILKTAKSTAGIGEVIGQIEAGTAPVKAAPVAAATPAPAPAGPAAQEARVMPAAERLMAQNKVSLESVTPSGPGGRVLKEDVMAKPVVAPVAVPVVAAAPAPRLVQAGSRQVNVVPMTSLRKRIAERLVQAQQTAAILTTFNEIDMTQIMALRKRYQDNFVKRYGIKLGFMSFFVKAVIDGLKAFPEVNAEIKGQDIVYHDYFDIGVAVGGEKGLVVPVVRNAEGLGFAELEQRIADYGKRAQENKLKLEELQGGTFTISNGGVFGSLMSTPILNPPQSGILGMHSIVERPVGIEGRIELRPMMYVALSYDHRIVDGRGAVSFLKRVKDCIEEPSRLLLEI